MNERYGNNPGNMKQRLTFLKPPIDNGTGWRSTEWTEYATVWAELRTLKGNRLSDMAVVQMQNVVTFGVRYRDDLNDEMRLLHKGIQYDIDSMYNDDGNNQWFTILAKEVL